MATQYDTMIQNLNIDGLAQVIEIIGEASQGGSVASIAVGDIQNDLRVQLKLAPNRISTVMQCFAEIGVCGYEADNRQIILTTGFPWGYEQQAERRKRLVDLLQTAGLIEINNQQDNPLSDAPTAAHTAETSHVDQIDNSSNPQQPDTEHIGVQEGIQANGVDTHSVTGLGTEAQFPSDNRNNTAEGNKPAEEPAPPPTRGGGYGRGGRVQRIPSNMGNALSTEELLKQAGVSLEGGETASQETATPQKPKQEEVSNPPAKPVQPEATPHIQPATNSMPNRPTWGNGTRIHPPSAHTPQQQNPSTSTEVPIHQQKKNEASSPAQPIPPSLGRNARRPGATIPNQPMQSPPRRDSLGTRPEATSSSGLPAWATRRGGVPYGQSPTQPTNTDSKMSEELLQMLINQQVGKRDLSLDVKTLRALAEEINRYVQGLEQAQLADDPNLRVELQSLLDQITKNTRQKDGAEDA